MSSLARAQTAFKAAAWLCRDLLVPDDCAQAPELQEALERRFRQAGINDEDGQPLITLTIGGKSFDQLVLDSFKEAGINTTDALVDPPVQIEISLLKVRIKSQGRAGGEWQTVWPEPAPPATPAPASVQAAIEAALSDKCMVFKILTMNLIEKFLLAPGDPHDRILPLVEEIWVWAVKPLLSLTPKQPGAKGTAPARAAAALQMVENLLGKVALAEADIERLVERILAQARGDLRPETVSALAALPIEEFNAFLD